VTRPGSGPAITCKSLNMRAAESAQCGVEAKSRAKMHGGPSVAVQKSASFLPRTRHADF